MEVPGLVQSHQRNEACAIVPTTGSPSGEGEGGVGAKGHTSLSSCPEPSFPWSNLF